MKKLITLSFSLFLTHTVSAKIVTYDESSLEQDLNFKYEEEVLNNRVVASDSSDEAEEEEKSESSSDAERDVASDADQASPTIQYWKY